LTEHGGRGTGPAAATLLGPGDYRRMPWKNGMGMTTEIARQEGAGDGHFLWRASMAEIAGSGPFSAFPGHDRLILVVEGEGMGLALDGAPPVECWPMGPAFAFPGEAAVHCRLSGGPVRAFNLMLDRSAMTGRVEVPVAGSRHLVDAQRGTALVHALSGSLRLSHGGSAFALPAGGTAILHGGTAALEVPADAGAVLALLLPRRPTI
jgi:uncharacterized protein